LLHFNAARLPSLKTCASAPWKAVNYSAAVVAIRRDRRLLKMHRARLARPASFAFNDDELAHAVFERFRVFSLAADAKNDSRH
jgi:hypothetical protein